MKLKHFIQITACIVFSAASVLVLHSVSKEITHKANPFIRIFPPHPISQEYVLDIQYNSYYIAGVTGSHIYLGNTTAPLHLLQLTSDLSDSVHITLKIEDMKRYNFGQITLRVDSPFFYVMDGVMPGLFRGRIGEWVAQKFMFDSAYFVAAEPIGNASFALKTTLSENQEHVLGKESVFEPKLFLSPGMLQKQIDGVFCTDGLLRYNRALQRVIYQYFYRNEFIVMDTNMNLLYRGHTIDTFSRAQISSAFIRHDSIQTLSSPPRVVNLESWTAEKYLFVSSNLMAKNEVAELFNENSVIDIYDLTDGHYVFSFYLHSQEKHKARSFSIVNQKLVGLYNTQVAIYTLANVFSYLASFEGTN
ncbi:MAG TPA: hypothetical protein VK658_22975 [Chryseolinea sp.]|nr:hypothetical protein [Chryseolinea sp.]